MTSPWKRCEAEGNCMRMLTGRESWIAGLSLASGVALGAVTMYLCDPNRGRARRARLQQKAAGAAKWSGRIIGDKAENLFDRAKEAASSGIDDAKGLKDRLACKISA
jgi:hypothetical protein